ncbi:MAG: M15 family metallopeptidase [Bacteroidales bacterium]|nr:M15 family metallopeptidase [Bacteroidales bacterium]
MAIKYYYIVAAASLLSVACTARKTPSVPVVEAEPAKTELVAEVEPKPEYCKRMEQAGLVEIQTLSPDIKVMLPYGTSENFMGEPLYETSQYAYFQKDVAQMVVQAESYLHEQYPDYMLLIYDAARPLSVQQKMWKVVRNTVAKYYVSPPNRKSLHNYGVAVDLTIIDEYGEPLDMGCNYDTFDSIAHINNEQMLLQQGKLTQEQYNNRQLLRNVMRKAGFKTITREWWHFNACTLQQAQAKYKLIE